MHNKAFIGDSYMVGQPATENFDCHEPWTLSVASCRTNQSDYPISQIRRRQRNQIPVLEKDSESRTAHLPVCLNDPHGCGLRML